MTARVLSVLGTGASVVIIYFDVGTSWSLVIVSFVKMYDIISEEISTTTRSKHDRSNLTSFCLSPLENSLLLKDASVVKQSLSLAVIFIFELLIVVYLHGVA